LELLQWLNNYTYPTEARFKDVEYAKRAYPGVVQRIVNSGVSKQDDVARSIIEFDAELDNDMLLLR
jgi:cytosine/adenosine deaminase-related metal-dependent hydrolase